MSPRAVDLYKQAMEYAITVVDMNHPQFHSITAGRYSELIVIDCASIAMENENNFPGRTILAIYEMDIPQSKPLSVDDF